MPVAVGGGRGGIRWRGWPGEPRAEVACEIGAAFAGEIGPCKSRGENRWRSRPWRAHKRTLRSRAKGGEAVAHRWATREAAERIDFKQKERPPTIERAVSKRSCRRRPPSGPLPSAAAVVGRRAGRFQSLFSQISAKKRENSPLGGRAQENDPLDGGTRRNTAQ